MFRPVSPPSSPVPESADEPDGSRHTIEMGGDNVVIRAAREIDLERTRSLVDAVNAASDAGVTVVIDPHTERCDDVLASLGERAALPCHLHPSCRPAPAQVASTGCVRLLGDDTVWTVDLERGRLCRTEAVVDLRFMSASAWIEVVAVHVGPNRMRATTNDGRVFSTARLHEERSSASVCV